MGEDRADSDREWAKWHNEVVGGIMSMDPSKLADALDLQLGLMKSGRWIEGRVKAPFEERGDRVRETLGRAAIESSEEPYTVAGKRALFDRIRDAAVEIGYVGRRGMPAKVFEDLRSLSGMFRSSDVLSALRLEADLSAPAVQNLIEAPMAVNVNAIDPDTGTHAGRKVAETWVWRAFANSGVPALSLSSRTSAIANAIRGAREPDKTALRKAAWARNYDVGPAGRVDAVASTPLVSAYVSGFASRDPARLLASLETEQAMRRDSKWNEDDVDAALSLRERQAAVRDTLVKLAALSAQEKLAGGQSERGPSDLYDRISRLADVSRYIERRRLVNRWVLNAYREAVRGWLRPDDVVSALAKEKEITSSEFDSYLAEPVRRSVPIINAETGAVTRGRRSVPWAWQAMEHSGIPELAMTRRRAKLETADLPLSVKKLAWSLNYEFGDAPAPKSSTVGPSSMTATSDPVGTSAQIVARTAQENTEAAIANQPYPDKVSAKALDGKLADVQCQEPSAMSRDIESLWGKKEYASIPQNESAFVACHGRNAYEGTTDGSSVDARRSKIVEHVRGLRSTGSPADLEVARNFRDRFVETGLFATPDELWEKSAPAPAPAPVSTPASGAATSAESAEDARAFWTAENVVIVGVVLAVAAVVGVALKVG